MKTQLDDPGWLETRLSLGSEPEGVLVQEFVEGGHEVLVGMVEDPNFGPLIVFGLDGSVLFASALFSTFRGHFNHSNLDVKLGPTAGRSLFETGLKVVCLDDRRITVRSRIKAVSHPANYPYDDGRCLV